MTRTMSQLSSVSRSKKKAVQNKEIREERMSEKGKKRVRKAIDEAAKNLEGRLPPSPRHPKGRNPYAHVAICVKSKFQLSYKDIEDDKFDEVVKYIEFLKKNPS